MKQWGIWWRLVRGRNLLIVALTQYLLQYLILIPVFERIELTPALSGVHFALFALTTVLIAAGGYLINDLEDQAIDARNKPDTYIVGRLVSAPTVWRVYLVLFVVGAALSIYLAFYVQNPPLALIFPAAYGLLFWYSRRLKKLPFWGNLTVAIYCAVVPGIILFAERISFAHLYEADQVTADRVTLLFAAYLSFAFLATLWRELIKDLEDVEGDRLEGCRTLPIIWGEGPARRLSTFIAIMQGVLLIVCIFLLQNFLASEIVVFLLLMLPTVLLAWHSIQARDKSAYHAISQRLKLLMLIGLLLLFVVGWEVLY